MNFSLSIIFEDADLSVVNVLSFGAAVNSYFTLPPRSLVERKDFAIQGLKAGSIIVEIWFSDPFAKLSVEMGMPTTDKSEGKISIQKNGVFYLYLLCAIFF